MPIDLLDAHVEMLPVLQAREALQRTQEAMVATPTDKRGLRDKERVLRRWERAAFGPPAPKRASTSSIKAAGIEVAEGSGG